MLDELWGWIESVWEQIAALSIGTLLLVIVLQIAQTTLNGVAWRGILGFTFPGKGRVQTREIVSAYAGGVGINNILPAQAGTITYLTLFKTSIRDSTLGGVLGGAVVQNVFYTLMQVVVYAVILVGGWSSMKSTSEQTDAKGVVDWLDVHPALALVIIGGGAVLIALVVRILWRKVRRFFADAGAAARMLLHPTAYVPRTLVPQAIAYACRIGVMVAFMTAFDVPVTLRSVALVLAAGSLASTFAVTPGGVGTTQAAVAFVLAPMGVSASTATAYSLSQQLVVTAINIVFGLVAMGTTFGWSATRSLVKRGRSGETGSLADLQAQAREEAGEAPAAVAAAPAPDEPAP